MNLRIMYLRRDVEDLLTEHLLMTTTRCAFGVHTLQDRLSMHVVGL